MYVCVYVSGFPDSALLRASPSDLPVHFTSLFGCPGSSSSTEKRIVALSHLILCPVLSSAQGISSCLNHPPSPPTPRKLPLLQPEDRLQAVELSLVFFKCVFSIY